MATATTTTTSTPVKLKGGWAGKPKKISTHKYIGKNQPPQEKEVEIEDIKGLTYIPNFITQEEQDNIVQQLDGALNENWAHDLKRRVQQYGYRFIYETQQVDLKNEAPPIPEFLYPILQRLVDEKLFPQLPNQMIINEYMPGQGITPHVDKVYCFEEPIASISLLSDVAMDFRHKKNFAKKTIRLQEQSLLFTKGESRYDWTHGIPTRESDEWDGVMYNRSRRISLTFRVVKPDYIMSVYEKFPFLKKKYLEKLALAQAKTDAETKTETETETEMETEKKA